MIVRLTVLIFWGCSSFVVRWRFGNVMQFLKLYDGVSFLVLKGDTVH